MKQMLTAVGVCGAIALGTFVLQAQGGAPQAPAPSQPPARPAPSADPYATSAVPGATTFPLAAPAGVDSKARDAAPAGAANQGAFDAATWKFGGATAAPAGAKLWNPAKIKLQQGGKVTGATVFGATDPSVYCAMANAGYDFIWTEMQHDQKDWQTVTRM